MITINLLEVEKERRPRAAAGVAGGGPALLLAIIFIGGAVGAFAATYIWKKGQLDDLTADVEKKRQQKKELEPYIKRVDELEKRKKELERKNHAIEELRSQRTIPVHILDEVSRALPEYLWLTSLSLKGNTLSLEGESLQEQAIPAFIKNLNASEFIGETSLVETKKKTASKTAAEVTTFKLSSPITNPFKPKSPEESEDTRTKSSRTKKR